MAQQAWGPAEQGVGALDGDEGGEHEGDGAVVEREPAQRPRVGEQHLQGRDQQDQPPAGEQPKAAEGEEEREEVAEAWVTTLVRAIRRHDPQHMITVGAIPWAMSFPGAKPLFYADGAGDSLDFVSVHFYPEAGEID
mgnify:CR=1 FL=1